MVTELPDVGLAHPPRERLGKRSLPPSSGRMCGRTACVDHKPWRLSGLGIIETGTAPSSKAELSLISSSQRSPGRE